MMTSLETKTLEAIRANSEDGWGAVLEDLVTATGESSKVLRGVLSSLIQKNIVEIQEGGNDDVPDLFAEIE